MERTLLVKLSFSYGLTIRNQGRERDILHHIPSDTLYSAVVAEAVRLGRTELFDALIDEKPIIQFGSAFPFVDNTLYYPKIRIAADALKAMENTQDTRERKLLKKVMYWPEDVFFEVLNGQAPDVTKITMGKEQIDAHVRVAVRDHAVINRLTFGSALFTTEALWIKEPAGLYFLLHVPESLEEDMKEVITSLGDMGLGSNRSRGSGKFNIVDDKFEVYDLQERTNRCGVDGGLTNHASFRRWTSLGTYIPREEELANLTHYLIEANRGWGMHGNKLYHRPDFYYLNEGTEVEQRRQEPIGMKVRFKIGEGRWSLRSGQPLFVPWKN